MKSFILLQKQREEIPCPPEVVKQMAGAGKLDSEIACALKMSETTFRHKVRNSTVVADALREGRNIYVQKHNAAIKRKSPERRDIYADKEFDYSVKLQEGDLSVLLAVCFGARRWRQIAQICDMPVDYVVRALERLNLNSFVRQIESGFFTEFEAVYWSRGMERKVNPLIFIKLFLMFARKVNK